MNRFRVAVNFDPKQILELSLNMHPMQRLRENAQAAFGADAALQSETLCGCVWIICTDLSEEAVAERLLLGLPPSVADCSVEALPDAPEAACGTGKESILGTVGAAGNGAMEKIERRVGCAEFKALMRQLKSVAPLVRRHETYDLFTYRCYLFSIGAGRGLTTALGLFAELLREEALFRFQADNAVLEIRARRLPGGACGTRAGVWPRPSCLHRYQRMAGAFGRKALSEISSGDRRLFGG